VNIRKRLELWQFKIEFASTCKDNQDKITTLKGAVDTIRDSKSFKFMMQYILIAGNYMNNSTKKGEAIGFKIETLTTLEQIKSEDQTQSLLSFIVMQLRINHPLGLEFAEQFISKLPPAVKLDIEQLRKDVTDIGKILSEIETMMKNTNEKEEDDKQQENEQDKKNPKKQENADTEKSPKDLFSRTMDQFYHQAKNAYDNLLKILDNTIGSSIQLGEYLGEEDNGIHYMEILITFSTSVFQISDKLKKQEEIELKAKQREEMETKKQQDTETKKQQDAKRLN